MITNKCPHCGHTEVEKYKDFGGFWSIIMWVLLALASVGTTLLLTPFLSTYYKCKKCGTEWK